MMHMSPRKLLLHADLVNLLPEATIGEWSIEHFEVTEEEANLSVIREMVNRTTSEMLHATPAGTYVRLKQGDRIWMSNTRMEQITNQEFLDRAHGDVLMAGLGIGMLLPDLYANRRVSKIVVVEKHQEVIDLVSPYFVDPKLQIVHADIHKWVPLADERFNTIYFDIWSDICEDNFPEMRELLRVFWRRLVYAHQDQHRWMGAWMYNHLRERYTKEGHHA